MIQPVNLLLLLWVAIIGTMLGIWILRRRRPDAVHAELREAAAGPAIGDGVEPVPHPALIRPPAATRAAAAAATPGTTPVVMSGDGAMVTSLIPALSADRLRTLTDMLEGIKLPYDLTPVPSVVDDPDRHLVFLTTHSNAAEVGRRFADELERLGFELETVEFDQAVAVRGDEVVSMKIVPDADQVIVAGGPRYGAAGSGDVALETWIGRSSVPPSNTG